MQAAPAGTCTDTGANSYACDCGSGYAFEPTTAGGSCVIVGADCAGASEPFISQFQEAASGSNKYFQLYNPSDAPINLADDYTWVYCQNGCASDTFEYVYNFPEGTVIAAGGTWTICNGQMGDTSLCDVTVGGNPTNFNGNDAGALIKGKYTDKAVAGDAWVTDPTIMVDKVGIFASGNEVSSWPICWDGAGVSGMDTQNGRMYRVAGTCSGSGSSDAEFMQDFSGVCTWEEDTEHIETSVSSWP
jgi:hypothetical protein